jgi:two-component system, chemotaxis family, protein-glutamate methylesterase/glutaminase
MAVSPIRVLLVEDSPVARTILRRMLSSSSEVEVVGVACNGIEALELIPKIHPKVICTDLHMPRMGGVEFTRAVMARFPCPILVVSAAVDAEADAQNVFQLFQAGAIDVFPKPNVESLAEYEQIKRELITRIKILAGVSVFTQFSSRTLESPSKATGAAKTVNPASSSPAPPRLMDGPQPRVLAIGASTGGPQAFHTILKSLPANFPIPILCVQHISEGFLQGLVNWLGAECLLQVVIAQSGETPRPGVVYFAPELHHLQLDAQGRISLLRQDPVSGHCPSATVLFQSIAAYYRRSAIGILLTGMGRDGAEGLLTMAQAGGITIAQNESTCVVFGMPREAIALGAAQYVLPLSEMAPMLLSKVLPVKPGYRSLPG